MNMTISSIDPAQTIESNEAIISELSRLKTNLNASKTPSNSTITNTTCNDDSSSNSQQPQSEKVPTVFEWIGTSESVYLTGSFCNWKHKFKMNFIQNSSRLVLVSITPIMFFIRAYQEANTSINS